LKHRDAQLENYVPDIGHSISDYHHARPLAQVQKHSTRQFSQPNPKGHGRAVSRFTVVSNVSRGRQSSYADTEATVQSYDPFRASRPQDLPGAGAAARTNVIVHGGRATMQEIRSTPRPVRISASTPLANHNKKSILAPPRGFASRSSLASSTRSRGSAHGRVAVGHRRGVSFSHTQKVSGSSQRKGQAVELSLEHQKFELCSINAAAVDDRESSPAANLNPPGPAQRVHSRRTAAASSQPELSVSRDRNSRLWNDEVRQVSTSLAKTCEEAFNRTSMTSTIRTKVSRLQDSRTELYESPISSFNQSDARRESSSALQSHLQVPIARPGAARGSFDRRPLPKPPTRSESVNKELLEARKKIQLRKICGEDSLGYLDRMVSHIDHLMQPGSSPVQHPSDRRTISAPVGSRLHDTSEPLPSIHESNREGAWEGAWSERSSDFENFMDTERARVAASNCNASTLDPRFGKRSPRYGLDDRTSRRDARARGVIHVVPPSSPSPAKPPAPLNIRKKSSQGPSMMSGANGKTNNKERPPTFDLRQQYSDGSPTDASTPLSSINEYGRVEDPFNDGSATGTVRRKGNWFKRNSKSGEDENVRSFLGKPEPVTPLGSTQGVARHNVGSELPVPTKKKTFGFGRLFGKLNPKQDARMPIPGK
jgi:serine/threonine-protein kinase HSL1, negative regulator of Swe1 kinase